MDDTAIESDCLCKVYRRHTSGVTGLTLDIAAGEVFGLLGPAGAGKTTVLKLMAGLLVPTAGYLRIGGHDCVAEAAATRRMVGAFLDPPAGRRLSRRGDRPVLLVDEPALLADEPGWQALGARLRDLAHGQGRAVVLATRRQDIAGQICDRVALLKAGQMLGQCPAGLLTGGPGARTWWEIRVKGHLDGPWSDWFGGLSLTPERAGTMLLSGPLTDQAALYGLLARLRDLGLPLLSVAQRQVTGLD